MTARDDYVERLKTQLDRWNAEIDGLEIRARNATAQAQAQYESHAETLRARCREAADQLERLRQSSEAAWKDIGAGLETAWADLGEAIRLAMSRMK